MADYQVDIDVNVDDSKLDALENKIKNLNKNTNIKVTAELDDSKLQSSLKGSAKGRTVKVTADSSDVKKTMTVVNAAFKEASKSGKLQLDFDDNGAVKKINDIRRTVDGQGNTLNIQVKGIDALGQAYTLTKDFREGAKTPVKIVIDDKQVDQARTKFQQTQSDCKELISTIKQIGSIRVQLQGLDAGSKQAEKLTSDLESLKAKAHNLFDSNNFGEIQMSDISNATNKIESDLENVKNKITDARAEAAKGIELKVNNGNITKDFSKVSENIHGLGVYADEVKSEYNELIAKSRELKNALESGNNEKIIASNEAYINSLDKLKNRIEVVSAVKKRADEQEKNSVAEAKVRQEAVTVSKSIDAWLKNNSAAGKQFGDQLNSLKFQLKSCDAVQLNNIKSQFQQVKLEAEKAGKTGLNFKDRLQMQFTRLAGYFGASSVIMGGIQAAREMFQNVLDVDTQLTELYRVTDLTTTQYSDLYDTLTGSAQQYGAVLSDLISATADWSRAGFSPEDSAGLAEVTSIYQHISDLDYDEASQNLLTAYKGFQKQLDEDYSNNIVEEVSYVSDILNELDNNYSVTAAGVGEALKRSASAMSVAGNTIQETAGMVTGITEVTQDPEKAGNALKVVSMRLRGMKGELEDLGEDVDDNVTNISKMQGQILEMTHGKVNIFDDSGEFKSTYEILQGIADVWDELNSTDQAELLETVAGKHRANDVAAIFQNWDHVKAATESATEATGSAAKENEKYANSIQGHLDKLTSKWQEFSNSAVDSDFLKGIIQFGTDALGALDSIIDKFGVIKPLAVATGAAFTLAGKGMFKTVVDDAGKARIEVAEKAKEIASSVKEAFSGIGQIFGEAFNSFNTKLGGGKVFNFDKTSISNMSFIPSLDNDINSLKKFQTALETAQEKGRKFDVSSAIYSTMGTATDEARKFAETWDGSKESLAEFTNECLKNEGVISGSAKSFSSVRNIISHYNGIIDESGKRQKEFANIISAANPQLGNYLTGLNGASASLGKYVVQLGIAAVKTVALQAASMALNAALTLGISVAITAAVEAISHWINAADELSDKVDDVVLKYQQQKETLNENKKTIDRLSESYEQLSKGVNTLTNDNVSLSTDEYSEYCDIVNQIADTFPELISGYDAQGNAVLTCAGSVEKLNEAYKEAANSNFDEILNNDTDVFEDFKNKSKDIEPGELFGDSLLWDNDSMRKDSYEALKKVLDENNGSDLDEKINKYITSNADTVDEISKALEDKGIKRELFQSSFDHVRNALKENPKIAKEIVSDFEKQMASSVENMQSTAEAYIGKAFLNTDYSHISDNMQQMISSIVPNLGYDYFSQFDEIQDLYNSLDDMLSSINSLDDGDKKTFETYFDLQSKVNNGECTVGEYISNLNDVSNVIDGLDIDEESKKALKLSLQLDDNDIKKQYDDFVGQLVGAGKNKSAAKALASSLTSTELKAAVKLEAEGKINLKKTNLKDIKEQIQKEAKYLEAMDFTIDIDAETDGLDKFNSAMAEARSGTGLTLESFDALKSRYKGLDEYNPAKLFQETANGISLNAEAVNEYESALAKNKLDETNENIGTLKDKYYELTGQIQNCSDATQKAQLINEQEDVRQKINDLAELATMYEGLTSSYNEWQNAEASGNDRDMYENVFSAQENIQKELDNGWIDDGTKEYFQLIWGEDKWSGAGKSVQDYRDQWAKLDETISGTSYSISDFFKVNEDGELTSEGIFNFFDAVGEKQKELGEDWIQYDENGNMKSFNFGIDGDKTIADAMGISEELVQIFLRASQDCGFVVNFDGTYTQLADMQDQASAAAAKLKELGKTNVDFDFNTTDISSLNSQLEEAHKILADPSFWNKDGTFNFEVDGATEAMQVVSTLQATIDNLDNHYIGLTVEDDKFEEPLQKLQDYENKVATLNQLKLNPKANAEDIEKLEADIQDIVQYVRDHADDLKLDIDAETSDEDIQNMIESGEIEIPTTLDVQTNMSETLDDLKDIALLTSGLLTKDQELELKVKLGIATDDEQIKSEAKKAAKLTDTEQQVAVRYVVENEDFIKNTTFEGGVVKYKGELTEKPALDLNGQVYYNGELVNESDVERKDGQVYYKGELVEKPVLLFNDGQVYYNGKLANPESVTYQDGQVYYNGQLVQTPQLIFQDGQVYYNGQLVKDPKTVFNDGVVNFSSNMTSMPDLDLSGTITYTVHTIGDAISNLFGGGGVDGTAHANGTAFVNGTTGKAFKQGNWGTKEDGVALGGELGTELLVRNGRWYTIGEDGAEFFGYKKGDIIFNADQTKEIFEKGKITHGSGRGKALAEGTAFSKGTSSNRPSYGNTSSASHSSSSSNSSSSSSSNSSSSDASDAADEFEETLDWIETAIDRIERAISRLDRTATSTYKNWSKRTSALNDQINETRNEIDLQQRAYDRYMQQANSVGLSEGYASKVRNGTIDIETITDEDLNDKISEYKQWYEKAIDCRDAIDELRESESKLYEQRFNNVSTKYEGYLGVIEHEKDMLDEFISQSETAGYITSTKYYDALSSNAKKTMEQLKKQRDEMTSELNNAVNSGTIDKYSESWYSMANAIDDVTKSIEEQNTALLEYKKNIREIDWQIFDLIQDKISKVADESQFLIDLMDNKKLYEDNGQLTDEGMATMGQYGVKYNVYMNQADKYAKKIKELRADLAKDPYNQDIANQLQEYIEAQQEAILNAEDMKNSIKDMVEEGINKELDALQNLIDKYNDSLDAQKDLYDYQKKVKEQTKEIADLEKQMAAYQGDTSEETKAKIQQIKVDLESAKDDLQETEYEKYISDQQKLLDDLYNDYETILNARLDDIDALIEDMIAEINNNASTIGATIESQADKVGYTLSESMNTIWLSGNGSISNVITTYGNKFDVALTTTNKALGDISTNIANMISQLNKLAGTNIKAAGTSSAATEKPASKPSTPASTPQQQPKKEISVGGKINAGSARIYADSYGNGGGRQTFGSDPIYTVLSERNGYVLTRWYKLSSGYTGWFKKSDVNAYAVGAKNIRNDEMAWTQENGSEMIVRPSDGAILTPLAKNDSVLNASASRNIWDMANTPADFIKDNLNIEKINATSNTGNQANYTQSIDNVVFNLPNVKNYNELLSEMQKDRNFERLIMSMTIDRVAGKSSLAKGKAIR